MRGIEIAITIGAVSILFIFIFIIEISEKNSTEYQRAKHSVEPPADCQYVKYTTESAGLLIEHDHKHTIYICE